MTPELAQVVEQAYSVFGSYRLSSTLRVCHCPCCMDEAVERTLIATPLREVPASLLAEYTNSAHGFDARTADELRHFLPRYLELIAAGDPPDHLGPDICLRRLREAGYAVSWPQTETDLIFRFFDALLRARLQHTDLTHRYGGWTIAEDVEDVLTLAITAGGQVERLLAVWESADDPGGALHIAALRMKLGFKNGVPRLHSEFLADHGTEAEIIGRWLIDDRAKLRLEAAFFEVEDSRLQQILSDAAGVPGQV